MNKLAHAIVKYRMAICVVFAALLVFSVFSVRWIRTENDIAAYLPEETEARQGLTIMEEEFRTYGTARVLVKNITKEQARTIQKELGEIPDVLLVQYDETEQHYKDGYALYDLTFSDVASAESTEQAFEAVLAHLKDYDVTHYSEVGYSLQAQLVEQMTTVLIFCVLVVLAVLVFTSGTYAEIPVLLLTFLAAAVINMGTAFLMGTISFISSSVSVVMQLALSVDYAIIFCNRYKEERQSCEGKEAVERALAASIPAISASSLTTIAGLGAMTFMDFRLGADLGFNLIKAIAISLLTVFLLMPALLVFFGKAMDKTKHRNFVPQISFVGRFAYKTRFVMPILLLALVAGAYLLNGRINYAYVQEIVPAFHMTERRAARLEIEENFGKNNLVAVIVPAGDYTAEKALLDELSARPEVKSATGLSNIEVMDGYRLGDEVDVKTLASLAEVDMTTARALFAYYAAANGAHQDVLNDLDGYKAPLIDLFLCLHDAVENGTVELEEDQAARIKELFASLSLVKGQLMSDTHSRIVLILSLPMQSEETFAFLDEIHSISAKYYEKPAVLTGDSVSALDFRDSFASDNITVSLLSIVMVMVILFFTFRSIAMPLLLILVIQGSIWINFAIAALRGDYVFFMCYLIVSAIQMGANIDYAIVVSTRYREFRLTDDRQSAIVKTMNIAFPTIITSGLMMVCAGLLIWFRVSQVILAGMGRYVGIGTSISLVLILFALPQVLVLADRLIVPNSVEGRQRKTSAAALFFERNRRSFAAALLSLALVLALLAVPFGVISANSTSREIQKNSEEKLKEAESLRPLAERVEAAKTEQNALAYDFAEQYLTDKIGSEQLAEGYEQYNEGLEAYNEGKAQYDEGAAQLADAEVAYATGKAQLAAGQAAYDSGLAQYTAGKAQRDAAAQQLAEGQAQYDAGLAQYNEGKAAYAAAQAQLAEGQAQYDAGLAEYNTAKATLDSVTPLYNAALSARARVQELQAQYDEAVANGESGRALLISAALAAAQATANATNFDSLLAQYESAQVELAAAEVQLAEGKAQLDAGYAQLAEAEAQLAEAEAQLADGKAQLDSGYAQLADADAQLADAEGQLASGKAQLDAGYAELDAGGVQIDAGKAQLADAKEQLDEGQEALNDAAEQLMEGMETLAENRNELNESISALDALSADEAKLNKALAELRSDPKLASALRKNAGALETIDGAVSYYRNAGASAQRQEKAAMILAGVLALAALVALAALLLSTKWLRLPAMLGGLAALLAAIACVLLRSRCPNLGPWMLLAAALLAAASAVFMTLLLREKRVTI